MEKPLVSIVMGSVSDWDTMRHCAETLEKFSIPYERNIASAHRTPEKAVEIASTAKDRGVKVIIAAAGGAAHLAGVLAAHTRLPILGVPMKGWATDGMDSLLSTVQMPRGIPVMTLAIGKAGAVNAAISALQMLALSSPEYDKILDDFRKKQTQDVLDVKFPDEQ
ncbi:MAG: 5-(carboxyamino)imidazole ribonucleotide mutase [Verrucomicrobiaceae bacterium]|jgi:5-(carboxyamino)imidazole ribonucleotide mutase|nr:5-(carboxyamino)imidazole ribonucleotide mutase [Verrucomicrobiaceae bacterium]